MNRMTNQDKLKSYFSAVLALLMVIFGLLRLPKVGYATIGGLFTAVWLGFALLIIASHLRILRLDQSIPVQDPQDAMVEQKKRVRRRVAQS